MSAGTASHIQYCRLDPMPPPVLYPAFQCDLAGDALRWLGLDMR